MQPDVDIITEVETAELRRMGKTPKGHYESPTQRRSLSGKLVSLQPTAAWWIYPPQEKPEPRERTGPWYESILAVPPVTPVFLCECRQPIDDGIPCTITMGEHLSTEFSGANRRQRRERGQRTGYTRGLHLRLGAARSA